jgi:RNA polymerase sigma factor (TIGR02999 family)
MGDISLLISRARGGDSDAGRELFAEVYQQLHQIASQQLRRMNASGGHTTSLVHDVYFRLSKPDALDVRDRSHFYAVAGKAMRHLLIDQLRERESVKHGEGQIRSFDTLDADVSGGQASLFECSELRALEQAMTHLSALDADLAKLVELRFYAGLTLPEIAEITDRSERSLKRDWRKARAFLHAQMAGSDLQA